MSTRDKNGKFIKKETDDGEQETNNNRFLFGSMARTVGYFLAHCLLTLFLIMVFSNLSGPINTLLSKKVAEIYCSPGCSPYDI